MENPDQRISRILEILTEYANKQFSSRFPVSSKGDELDAITIGLNTLAEELQEYISQIKDRDEQIQTFLRYAPDAVVVMDRRGKVINWNPKAEEIFGWKEGEVIGKNLHERIIPHRFREAHIKGLKHFLKTGEGPVLNKSVELPAVNKNNEEFYAEVSISPFTFKGDYFFIGFIKDITERKKSEKEIQAANKELEAFTYSVSHDLRAPLRAVNGFAQMLIEDYEEILDDEGKRITETICRNATKMGVLIDKLLAFSRLGRAEIKKKDVNMNDLTEAVAKEVTGLNGTHAKITIHRLHGIKADYSLIYQVMINLMSNAVKYSSKKENPVIEVGSEEENGKIVFSVKDNGVGFDMKYSNKLFGVFQRLHAQHEFEGVGVGLAMVQRIIVKHGGEIWAKGKLNEGAIFYFSLPKQKIT